MPELKQFPDKPNTAIQPGKCEGQAGQQSHAIAIIGAGFSGTMAAIRLRRALPPNCVIYLIERTGRFARGLAYIESSAPHLLNVRAANMSAFPEDPGHFDRWVERESVKFPGELRRTKAGTFATRRFYGRYLRALLFDEMRASGGRVRLIADEVVGLDQLPDGWRLLCASGHDIVAAGVVLASGNLPSNRPCDGVVFYDPWTPSAIASLHPGEPVLIVGTGLTMVDLALGMHGQGFRGPIFAVSRRGLIPERHDVVDRPWPASAFTTEERHSALALLRRVRVQVREAAAQGIGWRAVIDGLRPVTAELWRGLPLEQRQRFLRHARPYWDVHRHRLAPSAADIFDAMIASGALRLKRGRVRDVRTADGQAAVTLESHTGGQLETLTVQRVIFATGLEGARANHGLVARLLDTGLVRTDQQGLGLEVTEALEIVNSQGVPAPRMWALGPIVRGVFWECLAVPDIRVQAQQIGVVVAEQIVPLPATSMA